MAGKKLENYAFIDGNNIYLGVKALGWKLDTKKFRVYLKEKYGVKEAFYFVGKIDGYEWLYEKLKGEGYTVITKPTYTVDKSVKGNCDAELVLHCMIEINNFTKAIIVSGDGDFYCLIQYLDSIKKLQNVIVPDLSKCSHLIRLASKGKINPLNYLQNTLNKV